MPRMPRVQIEGAIYYLTPAGIQNEPVFRDKKDYAAYLELLAKYKSKHNFKLFAFCLAPDSINLLIEPSSNATISQIMHDLNPSYTKYFNEKHQRTGRLFHDRYHIVLIEKAPNILKMTAYIHLRPKLLHLTDDASSYKYTSLSTYLTLERGKRKAKVLNVAKGDKLNITSEVVYVLGCLKDKSYQQFVDEIKPGEIKELNKALKKKKVIGSADFQQEVKLKIEEGRLDKGTHDLSHEDSPQPVSIEMPEEVSQPASIEKQEAEDKGTHNLSHEDSPQPASIETPEEVSQPVPIEKQEEVSQPAPADEPEVEKSEEVPQSAPIETPEEVSQPASADEPEVEKSEEVPQSAPIETPEDVSQPASIEMPEATPAETPEEVSQPAPIEKLEDLPQPTPADKSEEVPQSASIETPEEVSQPVPIEKQEDLSQPTPIEKPEEVSQPASIEDKGTHNLSHEDSPQPASIETPEEVSQPVPIEKQEEVPQPTPIRIPNANIRPASNTWIFLVAVCFVILSFIFAMSFSYTNILRTRERMKQEFAARSVELQDRLTEESDMTAKSLSKTYEAKITSYHATIERLEAEKQKVKSDLSKAISILRSRKKAVPQ